MFLRPFHGMEKDTIVQSLGRAPPFFTFPLASPWKGLLAFHALRWHDSTPLFPCLTLWASFPFTWLSDSFLPCLFLLASRLPPSMPGSVDLGDTQTRHKKRQSNPFYYVSLDFIFYLRYRIIFQIPYCDTLNNVVSYSHKGGRHESCLH